MIEAISNLGVDVDDTLRDVRVIAFSCKAGDYT